MARHKAPRPVSSSPSSPLPPSSSTPHGPRRTTSTALKTTLITSDPHHVSQQPVTSLVHDIEQADEEEGLRFMGYRGGEAWYAERREPMKFCVCERVVEGEELDVEGEGLVRCGNRDCDPGWFHLTCVHLPDHPPIRLGWMCPSCIQSQGIGFQVEGLWDLKKDNEEAMVVAREWLQETREEVRLSRIRRKLWREERENQWRSAVEGEGKEEQEIGE